ncbi:unnamed protein product, partial [Iphiclides podalirius]
MSGPRIRPRCPPLTRRTEQGRRRFGEVSDPGTIGANIPTGGLSPPACIRHAAAATGPRSFARSTRREFPPGRKDARDLRVRCRKYAGFRIYRAAMSLLSFRKNNVKALLTKVRRRF